MLYIFHPSYTVIVLFPYLTADDLLTNKPPSPQRYVIDFQPLDVLGANKFAAPFNQIKEVVLPARENAAKEEEQRNKEALKDNPRAKVNRHHRNFLDRWWLLSYGRADLILRLSNIPRYIVCGRVTKRPIFEFIHSEIRPNDALQVFTFSDDYSFGILQSSAHWEWFRARCSTLKGDFRYTSNTVFDSFPWPQSPTPIQIRDIAAAAVSLRALRRKVMEDNDWNLRELYRTLELPGRNPLKDAQITLDKAVRAAYGMKRKDATLEFLLNLNLKLAEVEAVSQILGSDIQLIVGPGLPPIVRNRLAFVTTDCVRIA